MGIDGIHILYEVDADDAARRVRLTQEQIIAILVQQHRNGEHTYGKMHRACPLCH